MLLFSDIRMEYKDYKMGNHCFVVFPFFTESLEKTKEKNVGAEKVAARAIHGRQKVSVIRRKSSISESGRNTHTHTHTLSLSLSLFVRGREVQINPVAV